MAEHIIKMPDVGEGVTEAEIVAWHVNVGDTVTEDQDLCDVMTDKATVEIPSPVSGVVVNRAGEPGDMVPVGSQIIVISTDGTGSAKQSSTDEAQEPEPVPDANVMKTENIKASEAQHAVPLPPAPTSKLTAPTGARTLASPAVRQRALELDVDLSTVAGSGPAGRVLPQDLEDFIAAGGRAMAKSSAPPQAHTSDKVTKIIGLRRKIAENMEKAWTVPLITYVEEVDVTDIETLRASLNANRKADQPKLTLLPFLAIALAKSVAKVPQTNAHYDAETQTLTEFASVNIGIATATDRGLMVPVLKQAETLDLWQIAAAISDLSQAAKDGSAAREVLTGSTITITSLGALGGVVSTPILNLPETSIVGVNKITERPMFDAAGHVVPRKFMNLSSSFDHRIVDGYDAALLIQSVRTYLETPATLFIPGV